MPHVFPKKKKNIFILKKNLKGMTNNVRFAWSVGDAKYNI